MCQYSRHYGRHWDRSVSKCCKCHNRGSPDRQGTHGRESGIDPGMERCPRKLSYLEKVEGPTRKREAQEERLACNSIAADASVDPPGNSEIELALQKAPK